MSSPQLQKKFSVWKAFDETRLFRSSSTEQRSQLKRQFKCLSCRELIKGQWVLGLEYSYGIRIHDIYDIWSWLAGYDPNDWTPKWCLEYWTQSNCVFSVVWFLSFWAMAKDVFGFIGLNTGISPDSWIWLRGPRIEKIQTDVSSMVQRGYL